ncbi:hypothetical protein MRX96_031971 [Rhipicephalus microplus]
MDSACSPLVLPVSSSSIYHEFRRHPASAVFVSPRSHDIRHASERRTSRRWWTVQRARAHVVPLKTAHRKARRPMSARTSSRRRRGHAISAASSCLPDGHSFGRRSEGRN